MDKKQQNQLLQQLAGLSSEARNPDTYDIDLLSSLEIVQKINQQDQLVAQAVAQCLPDVAKAVDHIVHAFANGGRLVYIGAGTSGRLGILDAVECPPTYSVSDGLVVALIAGGEQAIYKAVEGAEDNPALAVTDLKRIHFSEKDVLVGLAASGRTPYVIGALDYASSIGAVTVAVSCNLNTPILSKAQIAICAVVGPEVVTGSTRMKSGTAQKLILNMLTTASMIRSGKVYQNLMVDLSATNAKLEARAIRIVTQATDCDVTEAYHALQLADMNAKLAILHILTGYPIQECRTQLEKHQGFIRHVLKHQEKYRA